MFYTDEKNANMCFHYAIEGALRFVATVQVKHLRGRSGDRRSRGTLLNFSPISTGANGRWHGSACFHALGPISKGATDAAKQIGAG